MATQPRRIDPASYDAAPSAAGPLAQIDDATLDRFMTEIDQHIDARLANWQPPAPPAHHQSGAGGAAGIIAAGIPFVVLAGVFGHEAGVVFAVLVTGAVAFAQTLRNPRP